MGQRRISWFEQNIEKVVMGVVGVSLLGVVALQALHQPNKVKVGPGPAVPPWDAYKPAEKNAQDLLGQVRSTTPAESPKVTIDMPGMLDSRLKGGVVPSPKMASLGAKPKIKPTDPTGGAVGKETIAELKVGAPTNVIGAAHAATIHPLERVWHADLAAVLPAQQPFDKVGVSVEGTFNGVALANALEIDPDGEGPIQPIPLGLWQDPMTKEIFVDVVCVEMERELVRAAPGSKEAVGTKAMISGMPGRVDARKQWNESVRSLADVKTNLEQIRAMDEQIQRPPYYALIAGLAWEEPKEMRDRWMAGNDPALINKLKSDLAAAREQLKVAEEELARLPVPGAQPGGRDTPPPPPRGVGRPGGGGGRPGGGTGPSPRPTQPKDQDPATLRLNAQSKVNNLKSKVATIERRLGKLGVNIAQPAQSDQPEVVAPALTLHQNDEVKLWAHDMSAVPGAAYRYRMRVVVNNPLFGANLVEAQKSLGTDSLLAGEFSEWSDIVEVDNLSDFFIISASESNPPASIQPASNAQLFVYYYGKWRAANVSVNPGDVFAAEITMPEYPIYDLTKLLAMFPPDKGIPGAPSSPDASPTTTDPRRPGRMAPAPTTPPPAPGPGTTPDANKALDGVALIEGVPSTPGPKTLAAGVSSLFLDAQRLVMPGTDLNNRQREVVAAILRDPNGQVVARSPEDDRNSASYRRIVAYQKAQEAQKAPPAAAKPPVNQQPNPGRQERPPSPGSGGGGGGGGG